MLGLINLRRVRKIIYYEKAIPTKPSSQEVLVETTDLRPEKHAMGTEKPDSANVHDQEKPTIQEGEMQFNDVSESDISMDEDWPTLSSANLQSTVLPQVNQHLSMEYLQHRQVNSKDLLELPIDRQGIGIPALKPVSKQYRVDVARKYRNQVRPDITVHAVA